MEELFAEFVKTLKKRFGNYNEDQHRFEKSSNSEIARELGYSDAQFSRLINGSATEGEYQRANQNLNRLVLIDTLESQLDDCKNGKKESQAKKLLILSSSILFILTLFFAYQHLTSSSTVNKHDGTVEGNRDATLKWAFETSYVKPYIRLDDLPEDCNYPCYKYQGKWTLDESYKLPFFREQNGYHYLATEVNMYARCMTEEEYDGNKFEGYEYQRHEIWYDKRELPVDSFIKEDGRIKAFYKEMKFSENDNFIKVASVHTFFRNEFTIENSAILRSGKVIGRDVEIIPDNILKANFENETKMRSLKSNINRIASNRLEDFSKPVSCDQATAPKSDFNEVSDGDIMSFRCELTTSRVALDYKKSYKLADQYIKNTCRPSED